VVAEEEWVAGKEAVNQLAARIAEDRQIKLKHATRARTV
jgi:hypothetical protein